MGKQPAEFIPVKYVNDEADGPNMFTIILAGFVLLTGYQIYRSVKPGGSSGKPGKGVGKNKGSSSNWFGGGNMMGNM